ncbi:MAG: nucleoside kinase [Acidobacteria bacterium]|nr:MAG: nucleoside kinase [Acidobacteriota bacterium]
MRRMIEIHCENTGEKKQWELGTSLTEIADQLNIQTRYPILGAMVNNELKEMDYNIFKPKRVRFIDITHPDGMRMVVRSLCFVLHKAVRDLFPNAFLTIEHSVSKGFYCEIDGLPGKLNRDTISRLRERMKALIRNNMPFRRVEMETEKAVELFHEVGMEEKAQLFRERVELYTSVYYLDNTIGYFYGYLVPSTGMLQVFDLVPYYDGMLLRFPRPSDPTKLEDVVPQDKMFEIFQEHKQWAEILNLGYVCNLNDCIEKPNHGQEIIRIAEALQEKKVAQMADLISRERDRIRIVLISGPSSSGKTTFSKRLRVQLKVAGMKPIAISLDNYFVDRDKTPKDENGDYDFEALEALDIPLFNRNLNKLLAGEKVQLPRYDFQLGKSLPDGQTLQISQDHVIIIEGIHGLNPRLIPSIDKDLTYKVYVSALTQISVDGQNRIPTTDNRLIRRIVRDHKYRGHSALETLHRWPSVRRGEEKNIFPYQENADIMFNSALLYELAVLKEHAEPLLEAVYQNQPEFAEVKRLLKFLSYFKPLSSRFIPPTSILREFLGGSSFHYE